MHRVPVPADSDREPETRITATTKQKRTLGLSLGATLRRLSRLHDHVKKRSTKKSGSLQPQATAAMERMAKKRRQSFCSSFCRSSHTGNSFSTKKTSHLTLTLLLVSTSLNSALVPYDERHPLSTFSIWNQVSTRGFSMMLQI